MFENPRRGRQARNFTTNVPKILDLKSSSEQIFSKNCRWVRLLFIFNGRGILHYFNISKIFPVSVSKIQYNFHQNLKKQTNKQTNQKLMSENLWSIFLSVSTIYSSPVILILKDCELLLFICFFCFFWQFKSRKTRKIQTADEKRSCNKKCKVRKKSRKILYLLFIAYFTYHVNFQVPGFFTLLEMISQF